MNLPITFNQAVYTLVTEYGDHWLLGPGGRRVARFTCQRKGQDAYGKTRWWWSWPETTNHWPTAGQAVTAYLTQREAAA